MAVDGVTVNEDNTEECAQGIVRAIDRALEEIGLAAEGYAKRACPVDTGNLRNSITHAVEPGEDAVYVGTDVVQAVVNMIPDWVTNGLNVASKILTAYGLALLLTMMINKGMTVFLILGFALASYLGLSVTAVSIFAVVLALILMSLKYGDGSGAAMASAGGADPDYDPLEDDDED